MTEVSAPLDVAHLRSWIGRQDTVDDLLTVDLVRKFRATFNQPGEVRVGDVAPQLIHFCLGQPSAPTASLGADGHPARGGFLPPVPLPRRMWAAGKLVFHGDLRVGDSVSRVSRIADVAVKEGRSGTLCFVTVEHDVLIGGDRRIEERQVIVYREPDAAAPSQPPSPVDPAPEGERQRRVEPTAALLFRYSAMTFNGHLIHYDRTYATQVEGYPGLVVHGPMQATMLLQLATELRGKAPAQFSFRSESPLFDSDPIVLHATDTAQGMSLWTTRENGPFAMRADAAWS
ncbi:MaoC family dehydratase N-terminal domain-containing protein [Mesorhizobium sp. CAU 1741]|uniref:FAS1-like dehydratase domain-containing protein n=1 Tax=Mesorhizobium sp. CAU 1741 TaxID=3140366 RepID=UPI00325C0099